MVGQIVVVAVTILLNGVCAAEAAQLKPIHLHPDYDHARYVTLPTDQSDIVRHFRAYTTVFDGADDDDGDGVPDALGIPEFVTYELKRHPGNLGKAPDRPSPWITDSALRQAGLAPSDDSYRYSRAFRRNNPNWYVRGHLCMKHHAWRLGAEADWNTHTVLNAVPQRDAFNSGIWLDLENKTAAWADKFGRVWVIAGPIFLSRSFTEATPTIGEPQKGEMRIAIPDELFKIIIRETEQGHDVLAFKYPQSIHFSDTYDHIEHAVTIDEIEALTGHDFLAIIPDSAEDTLEAQKATALWD